MPRPKHTYKACTTVDCDRDQVARGYCARHYRKLRRSGDLPLTQTRNIDMVRERGGVTCRVCGRHVMEHGLTEFCDLIDRRLAV